MKLSEEIKEEIKRESEEYLNEIKSGTDQYGGLTKDERDELGAFYTPPSLCVQMLEMYDCTLEEFATKTILDPTCGSGNLIMAALITGTMSGNRQYYKNVFGNELSLKPLELCRKRFVHWCKENLKDAKEDWEEFWSWHLHQGDALRKNCISLESFKPKYKFLEELIDAETYAKLPDTLKSQYKPDKIEEQKIGLLNTKKIVKTWKLKG